MFLSRMIRNPLSAAGGLAAALAAALLAAAPASAQPLGSSKMWPWNIKGASEIPLPTRVPQTVVAVAPHPTAAFSGALKVVVTIPASAASSDYVTLRGPSGEVRKVPLEGGRETIVYREVTVRPGERLTLNLMPSRLGGR